MKKILSVLLVVFLTFSLASCEEVGSGKRGVKVKYSSGTDMSQTYDEGTYWGISWIWNDMVEYDVREHTMVETFKFNDANDMIVTVKIALDYSLSKMEVNKIHKDIADIKTKISTSLSSAAKEVVTLYSAVDLNKKKRVEGEIKLQNILRQELPEFYAEFKRVRFTDIDIPQGISDLAEQTAEQIGKNELATKMEAEKQSLAKALVAESKGKYEAAQFDVKTKELMSRPAVLRLYEAETERKWAEKGISKYGNNNVFGSGASIIKGLKQYEKININFGNDIDNGIMCGQ